MIEASYGGPQGLSRLVDAAHARDITVIYGVVYNHLGPEDLDLWQFDGWSENGGGGICFYNDWRKQTPWDDTRSDYGRGDVRQYIRDNALLWLEQHRCDGLRFDATGWIRNVRGHDGDRGAVLADGWSLMRGINEEIRARQPWKIAIAEDTRDNAALTRRTGDGGAGFGAQWGARFMHAVRSAVIVPGDEARDMNRRGRASVRQCAHTRADLARQRRWLRGAEALDPARRCGLHRARHPDDLHGQEFLESGAWTDARAPDWSKVERFGGIRALYRDLIRLRRNAYDTTRGLKGHNVNVQPSRATAWHGRVNSASGPAAQMRNDTSMATTAMVMAPVASHPRRHRRRVITNGPMMSERTAMRIITIMIGTAMTPLSTADQNSALIGSTGVKPSATPSSVASVMIE